MSKVKQYAEDTATSKVDQIIDSLKQGMIDKDNAEKQILNVTNVEILGIDDNNVGDVIYYAING